MVVHIHKVRNKAVGLMRRNPTEIERRRLWNVRRTARVGKRPCVRSAASLVARVEQPQFAPRSLQLIPQGPLHGHVEY